MSCRAGRPSSCLLCPQVESAGLKFGPHFPIVEMAAPQSVEAVHGLVQDLVRRMMDGEVLAVHCRGGVGRAGLIACCVMLYLELLPSSQKAISKASYESPPCL